LNILVTGVAGFIGMHITKKLLDKEHIVIGIDNMNDYYDVNLKKARLDNIYKSSKNFSFLQIDICNKIELNSLFIKYNIDTVVNLAAQAGVRYSIENPQAYIDSNIQGFLNILEACRDNKISHLVYASSSSVYGLNSSNPLSEDSDTDHPVALYGATKKANELMAHSYSHLYKIPTTGLRFFTVYGPWGRPDMALFLFTKAILENKPISVFNSGKMIRDFTFIDDLVQAIYKVILKPAKPDKDFDFNFPNSSISSAPYKIFNIGNRQPRLLEDYISILEDQLNKKSIKNNLPFQNGDILSTASDTEQLYKWINFEPKTSIEVGINKFVNWYKEFYRLT
jgi:UDP-glucuronate 4-epimerase